MPGYFAENSMAVRVMGKRAVGLTYGPRALVLGAANPRLFVGTARHTTQPEIPWNRLALTAELFEAVFFGSKDEADRALAFTRKKHASVVGMLPEDAGAYCPAGTRYAANDSHLMFMTMAFAFDSAETMHDLLVRPLNEGEREALWQDFVRWAELFGMPRTAAPASYPEFRSYFNDYLNSDQLHLTDNACLVGSFVAGAKPQGYPLPTPLKPASSALALLVQGSLPPHIRDLYGIQWTAAQKAAFAAAIGASRAAHRRPLPAVRGPLSSVLQGRSAGGFRLIAQTERLNYRRGKLSMPGAFGIDAAA